MERRLEIVQAKELRGAIIQCLYDFYGADTSLRTVKNQLKYNKYYTDKAITRAVRYLSGEDKNYIKIETEESDYWDSIIWLTPTGVNLAEGDIEDIGVLIDE